MDRFVVSTEDAQISEVSSDYGAEVIERPPILATDEASTLSVLQDVLEKISADIVVLLQPTSPIRTPGLIDLCIKRFLETKPDSLATGFDCHFKEYGTSGLRRQDIEGFFYDDGNIYVIKADIIKKGDRYGKNIKRVAVSRWENVEIDDEFDFWVAERILENRIELNLANKVNPINKILH